MNKHRRRPPKIVDSVTGSDEQLDHTVNALCYLPSWMLLIKKVDWTSESRGMDSLRMLKEYVNDAPDGMKPYHIFRVKTMLKAIHLYKFRGRGEIPVPLYTETFRHSVAAYLVELDERYEAHPVIAWDWVVVREECTALAEAFPEEFVRMFRKLRSGRGAQKKPKKELRYFLTIMTQVAAQKQIDLEKR